ncbi:hypothetical protein RMSM_03986 [Rhodopirellula maiorica SM1]|uniref:Uncharacterized protein n=1 Tax=Rhodopirellula maiorica SM1 TaxID=1265738 RepID=M5RIG2_9BACT|nr:hypothetical protein [Rhodopirellula maiorica]EMI19090.1 hypothetical protein RMSM_03986 [Rhodopirellula maiorica SM1]
MSRASDVRDAVIAAIKEQMPDETVEAFVMPRYTREELASGPRIAVRFARRDLRVEQGPDERDVIIHAGVVGVMPPNDGHGSTYRAQEVAAFDAIDTLMEQVIALWTPNGVLASCGMAEHWFRTITQPFVLDEKELKDNSNFVSLVQLTYTDSLDE